MLDHPLIPSMRVAFDDDRYTLLDLTVNPILFARRRWVEQLYSNDLQRFEIWIEFVIGHSANDSLPIPEVRLQFNEAFKFTPGAHPPVEDWLDDVDGKGTRGLYEDIWFSEIRGGDPLLTAFGPTSRRAIPVDHNSDRVTRLEQRLHDIGSGIDRCPCKAGLAFYRSNYYAPRTYGPRLCYPATWSATIDDQRSTTVILDGFRLFDVDSLRPDPRRARLTSQEAACFWYFFPYTRLTAERADLPARGIYTMLFRLTCDCGIGVSIPPDKQTPPTLRFPQDDFAFLLPNCFPRIPEQYDLLESRPTLHTVPRLEEEPSCWKRHEMLPMRPRSSRLPIVDSDDLHLGNDHDSIALHIEVRDDGRSSHIGFLAVVVGIFSALAVNVVSPGVLDALGIKSPMVIWWVAVLAAGFTLLIFILVVQHVFYRQESWLSRLLLRVRSHRTSQKE